VTFTRRAVREIETASAWWHRNRPAAADAMETALVAAVTLITREPNCGAPCASRRISGVRRVSLSPVSYHLYYHLAAAPPRIEVLAFWHARRGTGPSL
jgi:plasmid stabilization system protein ParE